MIERYVLIKLASDCASESEVTALADDALRAFPTMAGVAEFRVARQRDTVGPSPWHLAFTIGFADGNAHEQYLACPIHADFDGNLAMSLEDLQSFVLERQT